MVNVRRKIKHVNIVEWYTRLKNIAITHISDHFDVSGCRVVESIDFYCRFLPAKLTSRYSIAFIVLIADVGMWM